MLTQKICVTLWVHRNKVTVTSPSVSLVWLSAVCCWQGRALKLALIWIVAISHWALHWPLLWAIDPKALQLT